MQAGLNAVGLSLQPWRKRAHNVVCVCLLQILIELHPSKLANFKDLYPGSAVHSVTTFFEGMR